MGDWDLAITLDRMDPRPLYLQLVAAVEEGIRRGRFRPGDSLPGTRALAGMLGVNRTTALTAYRELQAEGWIRVAPDSGTYVADQPPFSLDEVPGISAGDSASWRSASPPANCIRSVM